LKDNNSILSPKIFPAKSSDINRGSSMRTSYQGKAAFVNEDNQNFISAPKQQGPTIDPKTG
jgi:hypothetical protein